MAQTIRKSTHGFSEGQCVFPADLSLRKWTCPICKWKWQRNPIVHLWFRKIERETHNG